MSTEVMFVDRFEITEGKTDELRLYAEDLVDLVRTRCPVRFPTAGHSTTMARGEPRCSFSQMQPASIVTSRLRAQGSATGST